MVIAAEEMRGIGHHTLQELRRLPDSVLAEVVPVWREDMNLEIREDGIYRQQSDATAVRVHLFAVYEKMMVDQYACGRNLRTIADQVAAATSVDPDSAFQATKDLFLRLCECQCCHPAVPPIP